MPPLSCAVTQATTSGKLSEAERDQIEAQLGGYMKQCNESIARLQASAPARGGLSSDAASQAAHQLGVVRPGKLCLLVLGRQVERATGSSAFQRSVNRPPAPLQAMRPGLSGYCCRHWSSQSGCRHWAAYMTEPDQSGAYRAADLALFGVQSCLNSGVLQVSAESAGAAGCCQAGAELASCTGTPQIWARLCWCACCVAAGIFCCQLCVSTWFAPCPAHYHQATCLVWQARVAQYLPPPSQPQRGDALYMGPGSGGQQQQQMQALEQENRQACF